MALSVASLAKKIKKMVETHPSLVEADATTNLNNPVQLSFEGDIQEELDKLLAYIEPVYNTALHYCLNNKDDLLEPNLDECPRIQRKHNLWFIARALMSCYKSKRGMVGTGFATRTATHTDIEDMTGLSGEFSVLSDSICNFQFKRTPSEDNPWLYSWGLMINGNSISRGTKQPIHKFVSALLKVFPDDVNNDSVVQHSIAELAKAKNDGKDYHWYLINDDIEIMYQQFLRFQNLTSCMAKDNSFFSRTGSRQNPMQAYNKSPDWRMMVLSEKSPEEIIEMCDLCIANPSDADNVFKFPFITRCMVLPTSKEESGRDLSAGGYVFGKFYGHDKLVNYFYDDDLSQYDVRSNETGVLIQVNAIYGGLIHVIDSTSSDHSGEILLPYFDKENKAELVEVDGVRYWKSIYGDHIDSSPNPVAKCEYNTGVAMFLSAYSPSQQHRVGTDERRVLRTVDTAVGTELYQYRDNYKDIELNGRTLKFPKSMLVREGNKWFLPAETVHTYNGARYSITQVTANPERFQRIEGVGLFDVQDTVQLKTFNSLSQELNKPIPGDTPLPASEPTTTGMFV